MTTPTHTHNRTSIATTSVNDNLHRLHRMFRHNTAMETGTATPHPRQWETPAQTTGGVTSNFVAQIIQPHATENYRANIIPDKLVIEPVFAVQGGVTMTANAKGHVSYSPYAKEMLLVEVSATEALGSPCYPSQGAAFRKRCRNSPNSSEASATPRALPIPDGSAGPTDHARQSAVGRIRALEMAFANSAPTSKSFQTAAKRLAGNAIKALRADADAARPVRSSTEQEWHDAGLRFAACHPEYLLN